MSSRAIITLTISNEGYAAYAPKDKEYSPNIVIERTITRNSGSTWKFRAEKSGKILGTRASELQGIIAAFSIDVDQPLTILTQDQARSFLSASNDSQMYKVCEGSDLPLTGQFFMRGTQLDSMELSYSEAQKNIIGVENTVKRMQEEMPEKKAKVDELHKKLAATQKIAVQKARLQKLRGEQGWALVIEKESVSLAQNVR
jgi:chromosome segregation ATPase